jgi:hypothetical protein
MLSFCARRQTALYLVINIRSTPGGGDITNEQKHTTTPDRGGGH